MKCQIESRSKEVKSTEIKTISLKVNNQKFAKSLFPFMGSGV